MILFLAFYEGNHISFDGFSVYDKGGNTFFQMAGVLYLNMVNCAAETSGDGEIAEICGHAGIDAKTVQAGLDTQDILGNIHEGPGSGAGEPAVLGFAEG